MEGHWFGIEGGYNFFPLNLQPKVHEDYLPRERAKDPPKSTRIHTVLKLFPIPFINCWIWIVEPNSKAIINEATVIKDN